MFQTRHDENSAEDLSSDFSADSPNTQPPWNPWPLMPDHLQGIGHQHKRLAEETSIPTFQPQKSRRNSSVLFSAHRLHPTTNFDQGSAKWESFQEWKPTIPTQPNHESDPLFSTPSYQLPGVITDPNRSVSAEDTDEVSSPAEYNGRTFIMHEFHISNPSAIPGSNSLERPQTFAPHEMYRQFPSYDRAQSRKEHMLVESPRFGSTSDESYCSDSVGIKSARGYYSRCLSPDSIATLRFHAVLRAKTAMANKKIKSAKQMTYLNKSQVYKMSIKDTKHQQTPPLSTTYLTFIRVFFEDERERSRPEHCWNLWSEGRGAQEGSVESRHAVEFIRRNHQDQASRTMLEDQRLDGFIIKWSACHNRVPECTFHLRFNFVSTAFSHAKGVKGVPLRLYAKTSIVSSNEQSETLSSTEISYCQIKLFRDHGAERKFANDKAYVEKNIRKCEQTLKQSETRRNAVAKKSRSNEVSQKLTPSDHDSELQDIQSPLSHKKAGEDPSQEVDEWKARLNSQKQSSLLSCVDSRDDPDLRPIVLQSHSHILSRVEATELEAHSKSLQPNTHPNGYLVPRLHNTNSSPRRIFVIQPPAMFNPHATLPEANLQANTTHGSPISTETEWRSSDVWNSASSPAALSKIQKAKTPAAGNAHEWLNVVGVDPSYEPPSQKPPPNSATCFYILPLVAGSEHRVNLHLAVYLPERTVKGFVDIVSAKSSIDPALVRYVFRVHLNGEYTQIDDSTIAEIPEHQDMVARFDPVPAAQLVPNCCTDMRLTDGYVLTVQY